MAERIRLVFEVILAAMLIPMCARPQTTASQGPAFEVASIKLDKNFPKSYSLPTLSNGRLRATATVSQLIATAYGLPFNASPRLSGGPDWIYETQSAYQIDATGSLPDGLSNSARRQQERLMLQTLLADRFQLVIHRERRKIPVYELVVDKHGSKLDPANTNETECAQAAARAEVPCHQFGGGQGRGLQARAATTADLVSFVENWSGRPLLDRTKLLGLYRFDTQPFLPMAMLANPPAAGIKGEAGTDLADLPTLFQVFERLGLKMKPKKAKLEVYVIDSVQRPAEN